MGHYAIHLEYILTYSEPVAACATEEQKQQMLPKLISGERRVCFGVYVFIIKHLQRISSHGPEEQSQTQDWRL
jgi:hypothetical protein